MNSHDLICQASKMAHLAKVLATKIEDLTSIP